MKGTRKMKALTLFTLLYFVGLLAAALSVIALRPLLLIPCALLCLFSALAATAEFHKMREQLE